MMNIPDDKSNDETERLDSSPLQEASKLPADGPGYVGLLLKNRYLVERELGRGGFGVVYRALDKQLLSKPVVIKALLEGPAHDAWRRNKFQQEIAVLARIDHPGVVGVIDTGQMPDGTPFLVMQFVEGANLRSLMTPEGMDLERVGRIVRQVASALNAAHEKGICHLDLKPENIMLQSLAEGEEHVKLIDFGIARVTDPQVHTDGGMHTIAGSPGYMAPEQLMGKSSAASDIYALGVIVHEMITGRLLLPSGLTARFYASPASRDSSESDEAAPELPEHLRPVLQKALSLNPQERYRRATDFARDLNQALSERPQEGLSPAEISPPSTLEIAHVLSLDLVEDRRLPMDQRFLLMEKLRQTVQASAEFQRAKAHSERTHLPIANGMVIVFYRDPVAPLRCAREILYALKDHPQIKLRVGVHSGPVFRAADRDSGGNVAGDGVTFAQEVMKCGDAGHVLLTGAIADVLNELSEWKDHLQELGEHEVADGSRTRFFNFSDGVVGNREIPQKWPPRARQVDVPQGREPQLGRLVAKMCNRRAQEDEFKKFFHTNFDLRPGVPQICVIHGEEGECHESLVDRLIYSVEKYAQVKYGEHESTVNSKRVPWQYDGTLEARTTRLLCWLFEQFVPTHELRLLDLSPADLSKLVARSLVSFVTIQHEIRAARWDKLSKGTIKAYLEFFSEMEKDPSRPQILIFLSIIYPRPLDGAWRDWMKLGPISRKIIRKRIKEDLLEICGSPGVLAQTSKLPRCPCLVLDELQPITRDDLMEWFSLHNVYESEEIRLKTSAAMFTTGRESRKYKTMAEIEVFLKDVHRRFVAERGYL